jgi:excisionase family DNA binding protein
LPSSIPISTAIFESFVDAGRTALFLDVNRKTLLKLARKGRLPAHPLGDGRRKLWRFRISELDRWMQTELTSISDQGLSSERKDFL